MKHEHLPEGWRWVQLRQICHFEKGKSATMQTKPGNYPFVVTAAERSTSDSFQIDGAAVCVPLISSTGHGDAAMHRVHYETGKFALANLLVALIPKNANECNAEFLYWLFMAKKDEYFVPLMTGTANVSLRIEDIELTSIPLPSIEEQRRIAEVLRDSDTNISRVEAQIEAARELKRGVMQRLFTYGLHGKAIDVVRSKFGSTPYDWQILNLEECAFVQTGVAKGRVLNGSSIEVPYIRVANVQDGYLDLSEIKCIRIQEAEIERYRLQVGDILLTEGGDLDKLGRGYIWNGEIPNCIHQNHVFAVRVNREKLLPEFLAYLVQSDYGKAYFLSVAKQTTNLASINSSQLKSFPVILPDLREQNAIASILSDYDRAIRNLEAEVKSLREIKVGLIQKLLSGEIRV